MSDVYLANAIYLKHVAHREAERERAEAVARINDGLASSPTEMGRARLFARLRMLRQSGTTPGTRVEQAAMQPLDLA